jgi:F0F1-type ATP synthase assembly protein I
MTKRSGSGRLGASFRNRYRAQDPDPDRDRNRSARVYQGAVESVFAIPVGVGFGWLADHQFESAPIGILVGAAIGFAAFVLRLVRLGKDMQAETETAETPPAAPESSSQENDEDEDWGEDHRTH